MITSVTTSSFVGAAICARPRLNTVAMASMTVEGVGPDRWLMARHFHPEPIELLRLKGLVWFVGELIHTVSEPRAIGEMRSGKCPAVTTRLAALVTQRR